ncbi:MAG: hypothetical protein CMN30_14365 [Sandaracinus sp.]|nr:hypothetical protein [Sandaracinus sp.]
MDVRLLLIEIAEKFGLVATAALVSVLVPQLRNRLLGVGGKPRDALVAFLLGFLLAMWGAKMGEPWMGVLVNVHGIGILIGALVGGPRVGFFTGLLGGLFLTFRVDPTLGWVGVFASTLEGTLAGYIAHSRPSAFQGVRPFFITFALEAFRFLVVTIALLVTGEAGHWVAAWPAHLVQIAGTTAGMTFFIAVTRVVLAREEGAVALVEARAAADHLALESLRRRLEPHFLFNALNTLRATIRHDPHKARELVSDLSDLYRYLLNHPEDAPVHSEVEHALAYLAIERARLGDGRLSVETDIAPETRNRRVPALLLQPLVENAVKHGVGAHAGEGVVRVIARREDDTLRIEVEDHCQGEHVGVIEAGTGIALQTLRERLGKRFGDDASLELIPGADGMCARVTLPWTALDEQAAKSAA